MALAQNVQSNQPPTALKTKRSPWHAGAALAVFYLAILAQQLFAIVFVFVLAIFYGSQAISTEFINQSWVSFMLVGAGSLGVLGVTALYCLIKGIRPRHLGLVRLPANKIWYIPIAYVGYMIMSGLLLWIASIVVPSFDLNQTQDVGFDNPTGIQLVLAFVGLVVIPPIAEELLFRGLLYNSLKKGWSWIAIAVACVIAGVLAGLFLSPVAGIIVCALVPAAIVIGKKNTSVASALVVSMLFGLAHMQWNVAIDTFMLSLALIWVYEKTNSLWASVALHALKNGIAYLGLFILTK